MKLVDKALAAVYTLALIVIGLLVYTESKAEIKYSVIVHVASKHVGKTTEATIQPTQNAPQFTPASGFEVGSYTQPGPIEVQSNHSLPMGTPMPKPGANAVDIEAQPSARPLTRKQSFKYNEINPGIAIRAEFDRDWSVQGGIYKNSYNNTTVYATLQYTPVQVANVRFGGFVGMGTGYTAYSMANVGKLSVLGGAMAIAEFGNMSLTLRGLPKLGKGTVSVVALEAGYKF